MRRISAIILALCLCAALAGCWDGVEIDDQCYLLFLALDKTEKGGIQLTTEIPSVIKSGDAAQNGSENGQGKEAPPNMVTTAGIDIFDAIDTLNAGVPLNVNMSQLKVIVFSEELARDGMFISLINDLLSIRNIRRTAMMIICAENAGEFAEKVIPTAGMELGKSMEVAVSSYAKSSYLPPSRLLDMYMQMHDKGGTGIAVSAALASEYKSGEKLEYYEDGEQPGDFYAKEMPHRGISVSEVFGTALFDNTHMVMKLTGYETQLLNFLRGEGRYILVSVPVGPAQSSGTSGENRINIIIHANKNPRMSLSEEDGRTVISIDFPLEATLSQVAPEDKADPHMLEDEAGMIIQSDAENLLRKFQDAGLDPIDLNALMAKRFITLQEWDAYDWKSAYANAEIRLNSSIYLRHPSREPGGLAMYVR